MKAVAANFVRVEVINSVRAVISPGGFFAEAAGVGDSFAATDDFSWWDNCSVVLARALSPVEQEMFSYLTLPCCRLLPDLSNRTSLLAHRAGASLYEMMGIIKWE